MQEFPGYTSLELIYESSKSLVYRAVREADNRPVIIKTLSASYPSPRAVARFQYEYQLTRDLELPGVIAVHEMIRPGNRPAMVLEDFGGVPADDLLKREQPSDRDLDTFFRRALELVRILGRIHRAGVIHKDINPTNILENAETGELRIIDFGISTRLAHERRTAGSAGSLEGTLPYISPEQTGRMNREIDYRGDYYSLGITFYEMLTGQLPFQAGDANGWIYAHIARQPVDPCLFNPRISSALKAVLEKMLAKNAEDRYQSSHGLIKDLETCHQLSQQESVTDFTPGARDVPEQFRLSQRLVGRKHELDTLEDMLSSSATAGIGFLMVTGYSGVGKSSLVGEIQKKIATRHGYFIAGKFDQYRKAEPYSGISRALGQLVRQILMEPAESLEERKAQLHRRVGSALRLMTRVVPDLERIAGPLPGTDEPGEMEDEWRFLIAFRDFIRVFAERHHPLTLFLDDLQWCDAASLNLIRHLAEFGIPGKTALLVIGSYRDNEVGETHPLRTVLNEVDAHEPVRYLHLNPLSPESINEMVAETLFRSTETCLPLTRVLYAKTGGNPFFLNELLEQLHQEELIYFDASGLWSWDLDRIHDVAISDHVVSFAIERLKSLPADTRKALRRAACIGNRFDLKTLALIRRTGTRTIAQDLWPAVVHGVIVPLDEGYRLVAGEQEGQGDSSNFEAAYRFRHDRLQQAAYTLIPEAEQNQVHLEIGRLMRNDYLESPREERLLEMVTHLNRGIPLINDEEERVGLAAWNLEAANRALAAVAYDAARSFLETGLTLVPPAGHHVALRFKMEQRLMSCLYLLGIFEEAEAMGERLLDHARTPLEKAGICRIRTRLIAAGGKHIQAMHTALQGLRYLQINIPPHPGRLSIIRDYLRVRLRLRRVGTDCLKELPPLKDPHALLTVQLIGELAGAAYLSGNENLYVMGALKRALVFLGRGNATASPQAYVGLGIIMRKTGAAQLGHELAQIGMDLAQKNGNQEQICRTFALYAIFFCGWYRHWRETTTYARRAIDAGLQGGEPLYTSYGCIQLLLWNPELNLETVTREMDSWITVLEDSNCGDAVTMVQLHQQLRSNLMGKSPDPLSLSSETLAEEVLLQRMVDANLTTGVAVYHIYKLRTGVYFEDYPMARKHAELADARKQAFEGVLYEVEYHFYRFLADAACYRDMDRRERRHTRKRMERSLKYMRRQAGFCAENYQQLCFLMEAELAGMDRKVPEAMALYDRAIVASNEAGFIRFEAMGNELAARFYLRLGHRRFAALYIQEATYHYRHWGAMGKVDQLEQTYSALFSHTLLPMQRIGETGTLEMDNSELDLKTVLTLSRLLSGEVVLEKLLKRLLEISRESAGAERAVLLLQERNSEQWRIQAEITRTGEVSVLQDEILETTSRLPVGMVQLVYRNREELVLGDAAADPDHAADPYIVQFQPRSILCFPIEFRGALAAVLYLENSLAANVFDMARIELLRVLGTSAAIALENAFLYRDLEQRVAERTQQLAEAQKELVETARYAGMAEIAVGVLHNVGNILNSINISADIAHRTLINSRLPSFDKANQLIAAHRDAPGAFFETDPKGRQLPDFLEGLNRKLVTEWESLRSEIRKIQQGTNVIRDVIETQQEYARAGKITEKVSLSGIVEDALALQSQALERAAVRVEKDFAEVPPLSVQKSKLIHVLTNLLKNGSEALMENPPDQRHMSLKIGMDDEAFVYLRVTDNGHGIAPEVQEQIFAHGFTTKETGKGFGLHSCANYMTEMGGGIAVTSEGAGRGATFTLTLPT